jgi:hypothetical protein
MDATTSILLARLRTKQKPVFKEVPLKEPTCKPIPPRLLLTLPDNPKVNSPCYFTCPPRIKMLKRGDCMLLDDVKWRDRGGRYRICPRGFPFDGMSYPWLTRVLFNWDKYETYTLRTAAMHDSAYAMHDYLCSWPLTRQEVDIDLLDGLRAEGAACAWLKYRAVRKFGWIPWGIKTEDPLVQEWIDVLWEDDKAIDAWIAKTLKKEAA